MTAPPPPRVLQPSRTASSGTPLDARPVTAITRPLAGLDSPRRPADFACGIHRGST